MEKINENNPDDVLKSVEDDVKLMWDVFNFLKKKINDIKGKVYLEDCNTVTKREVCAEFDMTNELLSNLHLGGSMTLAALVRALTFLLALRRRNLTWSSNFSLESMIAPIVGSESPDPWQKRVYLSLTPDSYRLKGSLQNGLGPT